MIPGTNQELALNNAKALHDQERHHRDFLASLPYVKHSGWTRYEDLPIPTGPSDPSPHWPKGVGSSFIPPYVQPTAERESGPLDSWKEVMSALTGYSYNPYPPVDPNERYQR
ncbi:hypothetical protein Hanom_Chr17g01582911 [Helianthus anomalus]